MKNIAIILARAGSKRLPEKNWKEFLGIPIVVYSILNALKLKDEKYIDKVIVSTDSSDIMLICETMKEVEIYERHESDDEIGMLDSIKEVLENTKGLEKVENIVCIYACAPLLNYRTIIKTMRLLPQTQYGVYVPKYYEGEELKETGDYFIIKRNYLYGNSKAKELEILCLPETVQDINTQEDWDIAEKKYRRLHGII